MIPTLWRHLDDPTSSPLVGATGAKSSDWKIRYEPILLASQKPFQLVSDLLCKRANHSKTESPLSPPPSLLIQVNEKRSMTRNSTRQGHQLPIFGTAHLHRLITSDNFDISNERKKARPLNFLWGGVDFFYRYILQNFIRSWSERFKYATICSQVFMIDSWYTRAFSSRVFRQSMSWTVFTKTFSPWCFL